MSTIHRAVHSSPLYVYSDMTSYAGGFPSIDRPAIRPRTLKGDADFPSAFASWSEIPSELLHAELLRRQESSDKPACGSGGNRASYNTPLHVAALVIILTLSVLGVSHSPAT